MPVFYKWDTTTKSKGEPITLGRSSVRKIRDLFVENKDGQQIPISRVDLTAGGALLIALPAGELQDRLNDPHATAPKVSEIIEQESGHTEDDDYLEDDDEEEEE